MRIRPILLLAIATLAPACTDGRAPEAAEVSAPIAARIQARLERDYASSAYSEAYRERQLSVGSPFARLRIPELRVDLLVVEGITGNALRAGAGHYPGTPFPGERGNVAIAGQRTLFGAPFLHLDRLRAGDAAILESPQGRFMYRMSRPFDDHANPWVTRPDDWTVIQPTSEGALTLTTDADHGRRRLIARFALGT